MRFKPAIPIFLKRLALPVMLTILLQGCVGQVKNQGTEPLSGETPDSALTTSDQTPAAIAATTSLAPNVPSPTTVATTPPPPTTTPTIPPTLTVPATDTPTPTITVTLAGGNGYLLYTLGLNLLSMKGDGSEQTALTSDEYLRGVLGISKSDLTYTKLSPDGMMLAIAVRLDDALPMELFVYNLATGTITEATALMAHDSLWNMHWSPDSSRLLIVASDRTEFFDTLYLMVTAGDGFGGEIPIGQYYHTHSYSAVWAPDNTVLIM